MQRWKAQQLVAYLYDQGCITSYRTAEEKKIPYTNHCVYVVNIITLTLKARISHKEKLKFCNYTIIKPLLASHVSLKFLSIFTSKSGSRAATICT